MHKYSPTAKRATAAMPMPVFFPYQVWLGLAPMLFGIAQFAVHGVAANVKLKSFYNPGLFAVVVGHVPLGIWYLIEVHQLGLIQWWDWLAAFVYVAVFGGVIMLRIGYGLLSPPHSIHPFASEEMIRWSRERRLKHAGIAPRGIDGIGS